jgi:1,4-dihydroxy-2-naphthoate octaprenyltransferase
MISLAVVVALCAERPLFLHATAATALLVWAYSFAPLRLSYRGGGELLQAAGVGVVLPLVGYYAQAGELLRFPWPLLLPTIALGGAGNIATALPDAPADARSDKRTLAVWIGERNARVTSLGLLTFAWVGAAALSPALDRLGRAAVVGLPLLPVAAAWLSVRGADARNRRACVRFVFLHGLATSLLLVAWSVSLAR